MRRRRPGKLRYLIIGAALIIALIGIIRMTLPEPVPDEHAGQVYLNDGFDMVWITPFENVPVNTLKPEDFRTTDGIPTYTGSEYTTYVGIDTSEHQWEVNWNAAAQVLDFAYVRLGYRGYTEGGLFLDPWFETNLAGASAAGLDTGVYFFSQATNVSEAIEEAEYVLDNLGGVSLEYPIAFDSEVVPSLGITRTANLSKTEMTAIADAFCRRIEQAGYRTLIYGNASDLSRYDDSIVNDGGVWWAEYGPNQPNHYLDIVMWQYSNGGDVAGIDTAVDMNIDLSNALS